MDANNASSGSNRVSIPVSNTISLPPVSPFDSGEGLPYAPVNWPNEGDIWGWRVGRRFSIHSGCFSDRFLVVPEHLEPPLHRARKSLISRTDVERYLQARFPDADIDSFFASFTWKIPVKPQFLRKKGQGKKKQKCAGREQRTRRSSKVASLETGINSASLDLKSIDDQISKLEARRNQANIARKATKREMDELTTKQRMVVDCLPKVVREIQLAQAQSSEWERKKKAAEDVQASILEKFAALKGFSF